MMSDYPVEDHIRGVVRDLLKSRGIAKTGLIKDINGTRKIPYIGLKNRLSLQVQKYAFYDFILFYFTINNNLIFSYSHSFSKNEIIAFKYKSHDLFLVIIKQF